jgi:hypothetical protein
MTDATRDIIKEALKATEPTLSGYVDKVKFALYLVFISPDFLIKK